MSIFHRGARTKPRRFSYDPRYYDPRRDQDIRERMRIKSRSRMRRRSPAGIILFILMLAMLIFIYHQIG